MIDAIDFSWMRLIFAFTVVMAMMAGLAYILKYISMRGFVLPSSSPRPKRIKIVETLSIDTKRRFVIIKCDEREHLLLLNANQDIVIESNLPSHSPSSPT